jgi:hypothetical protein
MPCADQNPHDLRPFAFIWRAFLMHGSRKSRKRKQIVGLTINEIRVKDGWADMIILYPKNPAILAHLPHHHGCN